MKMLIENRLRFLSKWPCYFGYLFFIGMMSVGYYYNLTFVQLGLVDLGERLVGMSRAEVAGAMTMLALLTCFVALGFGFWMSAREWGTRFVFKLRLVFLIILGQLILTPLALLIRTPGAFYAWVIACSILLGMGVPLTFSFTVDLIPRRGRGEAAALITAIAYLAANLIPASWQIEDFVMPLLWVIPGGLLALGFLAFVKPPFVDQLAQQHRLPRFHWGRFVDRHDHVRSDLVGLIVLMFGIYFVDSLGFLRLLDTPLLIESAWQSPSYNIRVMIGIVHVVAALVGGVLYDAIEVRRLFYWIFGIFALVHLLYTMSLRTSTSTPALIMPVLYAWGVSLYTVVNFAVWADISTPKTIGRNAAIGVALSGWAATFISTALSIWWQKGGMSLERHLNIVNALAILFLLALIIQAYLPKRCSSPKGSR